jgi:hypothetical protein
MIFDCQYTFEHCTSYVHSYCFCILPTILFHSTNAEGKAGSLVDDRGHFYKPIQPGPRGDRERAFYESILAAKSRDKAAWNEGKWSPAAIAAVQAIASGQPIAHVLGLDRHAVGSNNSNANAVATAAVPVSPSAASASRQAPFLNGASGSPRFTPSSGPFPFPSSPSYLRTSSSTGGHTSATPSKGMRHFPTFRAEPSFRQQRGGMHAVIRDPIEVLERDEVGLIDQLVEEEWLPWSDDEQEGGDGALNRSGSLRNDVISNIAEGVPIPIVRNNEGNGTANGHHGNDDGDEDGHGHDDESNDGDNLRYSRSPDSVSDDGLESNTGQHVMDGVMVAHSNSLRNQHSGKRTSIELMEDARNAHRSSIDTPPPPPGYTTTTIDTSNIGAATSAATRITKFIGNTPTRPLGHHRNSIGGLSHKSTDSIDEALRLHALSLKSPTPASAGAGITAHPILEERESADVDNDDGNDNEELSRLSSSALANWNEMPFTVRNAPLLRVIPKFYGVTHADDRTLLELEDLARWYRHPCIMDIKIGYQTWYTHAEPDYIERCKRKDAVTTQASLGFKICGMQVYRHARGGYWRASKRWCKTLPEALVDKALASFANNQHGLRPADVYGGEQGAVAQLKALESWFQVQKEFQLYSASLLLLYEGDAHGPEETNVRVRLVDFAHTFAVGQSNNTPSTSGEGNDGVNGGGGPSEGNIDENFLGGLRAFSSRLNAVSTMEYVADTLMTTAAV